jgi:hypothetical protein
MRLRRLGVLLLGIALAAPLGGCGGKKRVAKHASAHSETSAALVPTPDTTPVQPLRTPAGLVLKPGPEPTATPAAAAGAAPASSKAGP